MFRIRFAFSPDAGWRAVSAKPSNEFAIVPVHRVVHSKHGRYRYLPVLSACEPHEFMLGCTPYRCITSYLDALPDEVKRARANG